MKAKIPKGSPIDQHVDIQRFKNRQTSILNIYYQANLLEIVDQLPQQIQKQDQMEFVSKTSINEAIGMGEVQKNDSASNAPSLLNSLNNVVNAFKNQCDQLGNDTQINDYHMSKNNALLGKGSHSVVRLAKKDNKNYAIKIISYDRLKKRVIIKDQQITKMVNSEINLLLKLKSQYIIGFEQAIFLPQKQRVFIVLQYCSKGALTKIIYKSPAVPFSEWQKKAKKYMYQIALGIQKMHSSNIIHRDIKSDNVLINDKDEVRLIDFNVSCEIPSNGMITINDRFVGTKTYAPPELILPNQKPRQVDGRLIDIWALGVTYLEYLDRKHPFGVNDPSQLVKLLQSPVQINKEFFPQIRDLLQKMLKLQNRQRILIDQVVKHPCFQQFKR